MTLLIVIAAWYYAVNGIVVAVCLGPRNQRPIWRTWLFTALCWLLWPAVLVNEARAAYRIYERRK